MARNTKLSVQEAIKVASIYQSKISFQKGSSYVYRFLLKRPKHFAIATKHMVNPLKHSFETIATEALKYNTPYEFQQKAKWAYCCAHQNGWLQKVCSHMETRFYWDISSATKKAKKYKKLKEFRKKSRGAYNFLKREGNNVLHKACSHMEKIFKWTPKLALIEAKKYKNKQELREANAGCYVFILRTGLADKAFSHMEEVIIQSEKNELNDFIKLLETKFKKSKLDYKIHKEYAVIQGKRYRVDLLIQLPNNKIAVEYKSDRCYWNKEKINQQIIFYQKHLKPIGVKQTYLVSTKGKYGMSRDNFLQKVLKDL